MPIRLPAAARTALRRAGRILAAEQIALSRLRPIQPRTVLYESFAGNGALCNPEAIFRALLAHPDFADLQHVWALSEPHAIAALRSEFRGVRNVRIVRRGGAAYWRALSTAGYLVNNATFPPAFGKRSGQIYLNTWHGTPLKLMGFDMPGGAIESANTLRNLLAADYLLAANPFMTEVMYEGAYQLRNVYRGSIVEEGYPRIDRQRMTDAEASAVRADLARSMGLPLADRRLVVFAPTWRGSSFQSPDADLAHLADQAERLQRELGDDAIVLVKTHQIVHALARRIPSLQRLLIPQTLPTNVLLGVADALVTDYSSIFFDYLATGRPIGFLVPDGDAYAAERGTYLPLDELPGPVHTDPSALGSALASLMASDAARHPRYDEWAERFTPYEDGGATSRVIDVVFRGRTEGRRVRTAVRDGRTRLLFYLGGIRMNGITTSAVNLLNSLDPERYDVTALMALPRGETTRRNQQRLHPGIRQVFRIGGMNGLKVRQLARRVADVSTDPLRAHRRLGHRTLWHDEWTRIFGSAKFDWVADFSGYSPFWAHLMLHSPRAVRAIWLHNEMAADRERTVGGRQPFRHSLGRVFAMYRAYDQLVSVSPALTALNRDELSAYAPADRFRTLRNLPDAVGAPSPAPRQSEDSEDGLVEGWRTALAEPDRRRFVTVGRLSTEKNHARLIRAFARVHADAPHTQLFIVGGGPLAGVLREQVQQAGLDAAVFLTGPQDDPLSIMRRSDCFVLSSDYEGQPMVLIEAAQLGLPIVSTAFGSAEGALPGDAMHIVPRDDDALASGMRAFLDGDVPPTSLDVAEYTAEVLAQFDTLMPDPGSSRA
ncbi:MAG: glycosyltransferase [Candidatus Microbacterium phytovorans]|uniref:Glycosyltransferase n=1 Tax=Candidatus Microbacterium phytovorans TaxID=3121374 RepID=A0AAJ5W4L9_9MICO|nr:glycosyltransferase [Microbacterium sp.]WEK14656.1 MAG: glycosyltransferase [Microbacterium sp.]